MNQLQEFMARALVQTRGVDQELVTINGADFYGTFGDAQLIPVMTKAGYQDHLVTPLKISKAQFADGSPPEARQTILRPGTGREFFVQAVDYTNPVVFTFLLVDREL